MKEKVPGQASFSQKRIRKINWTPSAGEGTLQIGEYPGRKRFLLFGKRKDLIVISNPGDLQPGVAVPVYTKREWREFLRGLKRGDFDDVVK